MHDLNNNQVEMAAPWHATASRRTVNPFTRLRHALREWLLSLWRRLAYRHVMRALHRFNLHYAPPSPLLIDKNTRDHWCQWCGLRGTTVNMTGGPLLSEKDTRISYEEVRFFHPKACQINRLDALEK